MIALLGEEGEEEEEEGEEESRHRAGVGLHELKLVVLAKVERGPRPCLATHKAQHTDPDNS